MREYKIPLKALFLWQIRAALIWVLLSAVCGFFCFTIRPLLILIAVLTVLFAIIIFLYLPKYYKLCKIEYLNGAVVVKNGVIFRNTHILPFSRLIYTQTIVTPLAKAFGLTSITLKAARSRLYIPEITESDAKELIKAITNGENL